VDLSNLPRFARAVDRADESIDLAEAALLIAADAHPGLDLAAYLAELDGLADPLRDRVDEDMPLEGFVLVLNGHLFGDEGFRGDPDGPYDPRASYLDEVLDRRLGTSLSLGLVTMEVARRIGLDVAGVGLPGYFVVEARRGTSAMLLDPLRGGEPLSLEDCEGLVEAYGGSLPFSEEYLEPLTKRQILTRMLRHLKGIYLREGDGDRAWPVVEKLVHLNPESPLDRRDRGLLAHGRNRFAMARDDLRFYLEHRPEASDRDAVRASLDAVEAILAMLG